MTWTLRGIALCAWLIVSVAMVTPAGAAAAPSPGVAWDVAFIAQPTELPLTNYKFQEPRDQYLLMLTNAGKKEAQAGVTVTVALPAGVTLARPVNSPGWECPTSGGSPVVSCVYLAPIPGLDHSTALIVPVDVSETGIETAQVTVSGGGAPVTVVGRSSEVSAPATLPPFGFTSFSALMSDVSGFSDAQAGDHPFALTTIIDFPEREIEVEGSPEHPYHSARAMEIDLPAGVAGSALAAPQCPMIEVISHSCPAGSQVGTFTANYGQGLFSQGGLFAIYNVVPERGFPAEFGFYAATVHKVVFVYVSVRAVPEYGLHISIPDLPNEIVTNASATFFGDPQTMDGGANAPVPLLTNPTDCSGQSLVTRAKAYSWEEPETPVPGESIAPPIKGCNLLRFQPAVTVNPDLTLADEPTGYTVDLEVPQSQSPGLESLATSDLKDATITLPEGVSISPGAGDGLAACPTSGPEGINLTETTPGHCPLASQIGTVEGHTPLLAESLKGHVYVAQPACGGENQHPCANADLMNGNLFSAYLEVEVSGAIIKQHGTISADPTTGRLTASFKNAPQFPFSDLKLTLKEGPRAPLANPQTCGEALTTSDITPWSSPQTPDATPSWAFNVTGCGEGWPFSPSFEAGSVNPAAGAYTNFTTTLGRTDRQQDISTVQAHLPVGLLASISHVTLCGEPQAERGECPADSRIATVTAAVGAGSHPLTVSGPAFLTGPYNGAPFGLSLVIPAKAGPFNLGNVVTRGMLSIDPATAAVTVTTNPLPQIVDGVPVRLQTANVLVDRQQFMFNPTNCEAKQVTATIVSAQNTTAQVSSPFAAGGCKNLPFNPGFKVATRSPGTKKNGTSFDVKVSSEPGQANIHSVSVSLPKQLPSRLTTIQQACPEATYATNPATCPPGSLVGVVTGTTPLLSVSVTGPAYLVSHGGAAFPDLKVILQAEGVRIDLIGSINIKGQITSSTFASIPDAPITSFDLNFPAGPHSALTTNGSLCAKPLVMPTTIVGQNGRRLVRSTKVSVAGCPKKKPTPKPKKKTRGK
jgi:hypothetical protein